MAGSNNGMKGRGPHGGMRAVEKPNDFNSAFKRLLSYMARYRVRIIIMMAAAVAGTIFNIVGPKILGRATTELFNGLVAKIKGTGSIDFEKIGGILLTVLILYIVSTLFSFLQGMVMTGISNDTGYNLRKSISEKISHLPVSYFESRPYGEVLSRITNDVDTLQQGINQSFTQLITSLTTIIGVLIMMLSINVWMTLVSLLILPLSVLLVGFVMKHSQKFFLDQQNWLGNVNGQVEEVYAGQNVIKAFNQEENAMKKFREANGKLYESGWKSQFFSGMMMPVMQFVGNLGYVLIAVLGGFLVMKNAIEVGDIQSFLQYIRNFTQPIQQIAQVMNMLQSSAAASERVFEFLDEPEETEVESDEVDIKTLGSNVRFDHVSFGYDPDKIIINDFSCDVSDGEKIAIVGPTGAGKTTMVKLLMRFYDVNNGSISVGDVDIRSLKRSSLRSMLGMVLQDTWLFKGTIMENIRYGRLSATDDEVIAAAKAAHAHRFIMQQPEGYNTEINEESSNISQGQKQLITIARAILSDRKIMILDEATSSVDTRTEIRIQKAMDKLMSGRTSFVIAHRLSTIKNADLILAMKDGDIVEQGTHDELMEKGGFYADLYNSQFESAVE
jgi:ATP-binding cassette subfamily B multidrug efflux pump